MHEQNFNKQILLVIKILKRAFSILKHTYFSFFFFKLTSLYIKFTTLDTKGVTSKTSLWKNRISKNLDNRTTWNDFSWSDGELVFSDIIIEQLG